MTTQAVQRKASINPPVPEERNPFTKFEGGVLDAIQESEERLTKLIKSEVQNSEERLVARIDGLAMDLDSIAKDVRTIRNHLNLN